MTAEVGPQKPPAVPAGTTPVATAGVTAGDGAELDEERWRPVLRLPCQLTVDLPLPDFKIADLLRLGVGSVVTTSWQAGRDVRLRVNGALIGWSEFEVVGSELAVRVTELA